MGATLLEISRAGPGREISGQAPSIPAKARGLAASRVAVHPWGGERREFGNCRYTTGTGMCTYRSFREMSGTGKGSATPVPKGWMVLGDGTKKSRLTQT